MNDSVKADEAPKKKGVNVELNQAHTHAGSDYKTGDTIENVRLQTAEYMEKRKIGKRV